MPDTARPLPPTPPAGLVFDRVGRTFADGTVALRDVSLVVAPGEVVALLGPSGCGKSTLLRIAADLDRPDSGTVLRPSRDLGFVFQDPTLMPWASVADNVALPLRIARRPAAEIADRVGAALARVGLAEAANLFPRQMSGGMRMRTSVARALVTRPAVLLMDEPFAALDEISRFRLDAELLRLREEDGSTVLFVTHSVYEAVFVADRVVVMSARPGAIVAERAIDFGPRRDETLRDTPAFARACAEIAGLLRRSAAPAPSRDGPPVDARRANRYAAPARHRTETSDG